jgi:hypothetical protein
VSAPAAAAPAASPAPAAARTGSVAIVIEWENALAADAHRPREMLRRLGRQLAELTGARATSRAPEHVEVIVVHDPERAPLPELRAMVSRELDVAAVDLQFVDARGGRYYDQKNAGFQRTAAGLVVFLDSDVIPEDGWLAAVLAPFDDPGIGVVTGATYVEPEDIWSRAMALAWIFELRPREEVVRETSRFHANNLAFRREVLERDRFESLPGTSRGACAALAWRLHRTGVRMLLNTGARVSHPAPHGLRQVVARGLAHGRDRLLYHRDRERHRLQAGGEGRRARGLSQAAALRRFVRGEVRALAGVLRHRREVRLPAWQAPAAAAIATAYHLAALGGDVAARWMPGGWLSLPQF